MKRKTKKLVSDDALNAMFDDRRKKINTKKARALRKTLGFTNIEMKFPEKFKVPSRKRAYTKGPKFQQYHERRRATFGKTVHSMEAKQNRQNRAFEKYKKLLESQVASERRKKNLLIAKLRFCRNFGDRLKIPTIGNEKKIPEYLRKNNERIQRLMGRWKNKNIGR